MRLELDSLSCGYGEKRVIDSLSMCMETGELMCLLGANGSGKSTLFRTILGLQAKQGGRVLIDGEDASGMDRRRMSAIFAHVPQQHEAVFEFTVMDVVLNARLARRGIFAAPSQQDRLVAMESLERLGAEDMAQAVYTELSGGERQLALIARALAQQASFILLDEPAASLDFGNQLRVLEQLRALAGEGLGLIMTTHSPHHAFLCATRAALLKHGRLLCCDTTAKALNDESLSEAYGVRLRVVSVDEELRMVAPCKNA